MAGMSDYSAQNWLNYLTGRVPMPTLPSIYLALFTTLPTSNAGTGGTEVSGGSYARVQCSGALAAGASWTTSVSTITMGSTIPSWVVAGMNVYDTTKAANIGTVSSGAGTTTLTLNANASSASSGSADNLVFSMFAAPSASGGSEPAPTPANIVNTNAIITFPLATASWGTIVGFGMYDASTSGNLIHFDWLGNYAWLPFFGSSASPSVLSVHSHGFNNNDNVVVSSKDGGTLPATAGSWAGLLTVANSTTDTFTAGVNTTATGEGLVRKVQSQVISNNVTFSISAAGMTINAM